MSIDFILGLVAALSISGLLVVLFANYIFKSAMHGYLKYKAIDLHRAEGASILPIKIQAHERMLIFVDRINPTNLLPRLHQKGIGLTALQSFVLNEINAEYQHNITQQLYLSAQTWLVIKGLKDDTIAMINNAVAHLPEEASGFDLSKKILQHMSSIADNPYELTMALIRKDVEGLS